MELFSECRQDSDRIPPLTQNGCGFGTAAGIRRRMVSHCWKEPDAVRLF